MWVANFSTPGSRRPHHHGRDADRRPAFPVPAGSPIDVIGGSDGNVWYAGQGTTVGKVTPDGTATAFTSKGVDPFGVTLGPDGAVWFAEFQANAVGRVGTDGTTSEVTGMTAGAGPRYVATGPGNTIWFTEETGNRVGRVTGIDMRRRRWGAVEAAAVGEPTRRSPRSRRCKLSSKRVRVGKTLTIRYTLSETAKVTLSVDHVTAGRKVGSRCVKAKRSNRGRKRCTRYVAAKPALKFANQAAGQRRIRFTAAACASPRRLQAHAPSPRHRRQPVQPRPGPHHRSAAQALAPAGSGYRRRMNPLTLEVPGPIEPDQPNPNPPGEPEIPDPQPEPEPAVPAQADAA